MIKIIGYDNGGNIKTIVNGLPYKFATVEYYGQVAIYGIAFPNDNFYSFLSRSKKAKKFYKTFEAEIREFMKNNPL